MDGAVHYGNIRPPAPQPWWWYWITTHSSLTELILWHTCWQATHDGRSSRAFLCGIIHMLLFQRIWWEYLNFALSAFWLLLWIPWQFLLSTLIDGIDAPVKILMTRTNITTSKLTNYLPIRHLPTCLRQYWRSLCIHNLTHTFPGMSSAQKMRRRTGPSLLSLLVPCSSKSNATLNQWIPHVYLHRPRTYISTQVHLLGAPNVVLRPMESTYSVTGFHEVFRISRVLPIASTVSNKNYSDGAGKWTISRCLGEGSNREQCTSTTRMIGILACDHPQLGRTQIPTYIFTPDWWCWWLCTQTMCSFKSCSCLASVLIILS